MDLPTTANARTEGSFPLIRHSAETKIPPAVRPMLLPPGFTFEEWWQQYWITRRPRFSTRAGRTVSERSDTEHAVCSEWRDGRFVRIRVLRLGKFGDVQPASLRADVPAAGFRLQQTVDRLTAAPKCFIGPRILWGARAGYALSVLLDCLPGASPKRKALAETISRPHWHARTPEQEDLVQQYLPLAVSIGTARGKNRVDRLRFRHNSRLESPEDEIQEARLALIEALTASGQRPNAYAPRDGIDFSVPLRARIDGAVKDYIARDTPYMIKETAICSDCPGESCPTCDGKQKNPVWRRLLLFERDAPATKGDHQGDDEDLSDLGKHVRGWNQSGQSANPERQLLSRDQRDYVNRGIDHLGSGIRKLSPAYKSVVLSRYYDDKTEDEIAADLGKDRSTVSRYLKEAIRSLAFIAEPYQDHRDLDRAGAAPRRSGGAFQARRFSSSESSVHRGALERDVARRARWLRARLKNTPVRDGALVARETIPRFHSRRLTTTLACRVLFENGAPCNRVLSSDERRRNR